MSENLYDGNTLDGYLAYLALFDKRDQVRDLAALLRRFHSMSTDIPDVAYTYGKEQLPPSPLGPPPTHLKPLPKFDGKRDKNELLRHSDIRKDVTRLSRRQIAEHRFTFYNNLCLDMLKAGYHRSFSELFTLVQRQEENRQKAGRDSVLWNVTPLSLQQEKLEQIVRGLYAAEDAYRLGEHEGAYQAYHELAIFLQADKDDKWLVDHFLAYALDVAQNIDSDGGKALNSAFFYLAISLEDNGNFRKAEEHLRKQLELCKGQEWRDDQGRQWYHVCCENLARVLTSCAQLYTQTNPEKKLEYLKEAFEVAKESGNMKMEGQCGYRLGQMYEVVGKPDTALLFLRQFYEASKRIGDKENLGLACEALAKACEKQNKPSESIRYLQEFVEVTEGTPLQGRACRDLGEMYNRMGNFEEAVKCFQKALVLSRSQQDADAAYLARVMCGLASGNATLAKVEPYVEQSTRTTLTNLLKWKNMRGDPKALFTPNIPDFQPNTMFSRRPVYPKPAAAETAPSTSPPTA